MRLATIALALLVAGCAASSSNEGRSPVTSPEPAQSSLWDDYAPAVKAGIDAQISRKNCAGLQAAFDTADENSDATQARTGHSNAALMEYIDQGMRSAGCY